MKANGLPCLAVSGLLLYLIFLPFEARAAGPILVDTESTGDAVVWGSGHVTYNLESGEGANLGILTNEEARQVVQSFFEEWASLTIRGLPTVSITATEGEGLGGVDGVNFNDHFTYCPAGQVCPDEDSPFVTGTARTGPSPILFDNDGSMTDLVFGSGARKNVLGFAGPRVVERIGGQMVITEAQGVLNGLFIDCPDGAARSDPCRSPEVGLAQFEGAIFHEIGHFLGLDHTQVNLSSAVKTLNGDTSEIDAVETMLPLFIDGEAQRSPHFDDIVSLSMLYPSNAFRDSFCTIQGAVYESDGETQLQGVNVVTRNLGDPLKEATSFVSGSLYTGTFQNCDARQGSFTLGGVFPGESYTLEIEPVSPSFTSGSSLEPCDPPISGFEAQGVAGTFSCSGGGQVITVGTVTNTNVVTTKQSSGRPTGGGGGGCSLIP